MAEALLRKMMKERGLPGDVSSAGLFTVDGLPATPFAIEAMKEWGIDLSGHRSRQLTRPLVEVADHVVGMTAEHVEALLAQFPEEHSRIRALGLPDIPDPYGKSLEIYRGVRDLLKEWSHGLLDILFDCPAS
ncbi:MAG: low molecular weight protein arginine phosphatase [Synergistaceae bacterium]|nr:low molecular weight protein arginine phosphatase [Synergistaceae bacterium]